MQEYEQMRRMTQVIMNSVLSPNYFIPYQWVVKPDSTTTNLRVVFNACSKSSTGFSLDDLMRIGPVVQSELFSILIRLSLPTYAFTTTMKKMYRQILLHPDGRKYQVILWRTFYGEHRRS